MWHLIQHWLAQMTGGENTPGTPPNYNFLSGAGSIIIPPALNGLALGAVLWWHNQCGVTGCYWYARRKTAAGERACFIHHPHKKRTAKDIHEAHHAAITAHKAAQQQGELLWPESGRSEQATSRETVRSLSRT